MKTSLKRPGKAGYISYVMVLSTGIVLTLLTLFAYRRAVSAREFQTKIHMRVDYAEKEDAILRSLVAIVPNRAMATMMSESNASEANREPLKWREIFSDALNMANARTSISADMLDELATPNLIMANLGDSSITNTHEVFHPVDAINDNEDDSFVTSGMNVSFSTAFPPPLQTNNVTVTARDSTYPIISNDKQYGNLAEGKVGLATATYPNVNLIPYPQINFGYAAPGQPFVAKRNWWAFDMSLAGADWALTRLNAPRRTFVLSIYEIPSQLAISSSSFLSLGKHASGEEWQNATIEGHVFAGKAVVEGSTALPQLSSRRGMTIADTSSIGGKTFYDNPFDPGAREEYQVTTGQFYPVSLASESGRVAFVPISRGADFFDRYAHSTETDVLSTTTWNNYSVGALQCAMSVDITKVDMATQQPTEFRFRAKPNIDFRQPIVTGITSTLPPGYTWCANQNNSYNFGAQVVDVAYGAGGRYYFQSGVTGVVMFDNARFGNPYPGVGKAGYWRPAAPFKATPLPSGERLCVEIFPQRMAAFLNRIGASNTSVNNSLSVNVDYTTSGLNNPDFKPIQNGRYVETLPGNFPNFGVILNECSNFSSFTKGFSLVSNLRTYFADDFNTTAVAPPADMVVTGSYYPPVSLFVPEKRYGVHEDPYSVNLSGSLGSLASENAAEPVRLLDAKSVTGRSIDAEQIRVNLAPITHPAALPPITMMNWLVVLEELREEYED